MPSFDLVAGEGLRAHFESEEARLLRELLAEMNILLEADVPRIDPVKQRLLPDAYDDPDAAENYRGLTEDDLMQAKREALRAVRQRLGERGGLDASIPEEEVSSWLAVLTDLRLAIGVRLDVDEAKMETELDPDDPDAPAMSVLHWLGWVQGTMLGALGWEGP
jgi:hypothetical protein